MGQAFDLDRETWTTLRALLDIALEMDAAARGPWLDSLGPEHAQLKPRLRALLAHDRGEGDAGPRFATLPSVETGDFARAAPDGCEAADAAPLRTIGPYRLLRLLGEGGMGSVWLAERSDMLQRRQVALKLPRHAPHRAGLADRMAREREILAGLNHPNIARLLDAGIGDDGQPYLALEYVEGESINRFCAAQALDVPARLRLLLQVVHAVAHAHAQLVVHRDLKPANILVTREGDARLLDFGIAKLLDDGSGSHGADSALTELTGLAMTPDYAAPEQIMGRSSGTAADIYSLGVVLYELLTGARPYRLSATDRHRRAALEEVIVHTEPVRPSIAAGSTALRKALRGDLDTIVLKALKKAPQERYPTADALAQDIERHLAHEPVLAQADSFWYRAGKFVLRHRLAVGACSAVVLATVSGAGVALWQAAEARAEQRRAEQVKDFVVSIFQGADIYRGSGQPLSAVDLLQQARRKVDRSLVGDAEARLQMRTLIGFSLFNLQDEVKAAEQLMREAVAEGSAALGARHPMVLRARETHALTLRFAGTARQQHEALATLIPDLRAAGAPLVSELARALESRVVLALAENRYTDAETDAREMLALATTRLGRDHALALDAMVVLASALYHQRRTDEALAVTKEHYPLILARHDGNRRAPAVIEAGMVYGRVLAQSGDLEGGIRLLEQVLADARAAFGPLSLGVGFTASNLARWQFEAGHIRPALASVEESLTAMAKAPGAGSAPYARVLEHRAALLLAARRPRDALQACDTLVEALERLRGAQHASVRAARHARVRALLLAGDRAAATVELDALATGSAGAGGEGEVAMSLRGTLLRLNGNAAEASRAHEQVLRALADTPANVQARVEALHELGLDLLLIDEVDRAGEKLAQALDLLERKTATETPLHAEIRVALARAKLGRGDAAGARQLLLRADGFWREFDPGHRGAGEAAYWLARAEDVAGQRAEARAAYGRASELLARSSMPGDAALAGEAARRR